MFIVLSPNSGVPVYRQLIEQITLQATGGRLAPGDEMPSTRTLSSQLGVNPMTVSKAYAQLERDGILERRPGRTPVVAALPDAEARARKLDQVRARLAEAVATIRKLDVSDDEAVALLRDLLDRTGSDHPEKES